MKQCRYILAIVFLLVSWTIVFADSSAKMVPGIYEVSVSSSLRVRQTPDTKGQIIDQKMSGEKINVLDFSDGWARIECGGGDGYVSVQYIRYLSAAPEASNVSGIWYDLSDWGEDSGKILLWIILGLSVITVIIRLTGGRKPIENENVVYYFYLILLFGIFLLEFLYQGVMGADSIWFCKPNRVGWLWTIVDFILFGAVVYNQIKCLVHSLHSVARNGYSDLDLDWGYYSIGIGGILGIVCFIFFTPALPFVLGAIGICQLIQIGLIIKEVGSSGGFFSTLCCVLLYVIGVAATLLILVQFLVLLMVVLVGYVILLAIANGSSSIKKDDSLKRFELEDGTVLKQSSQNSECDYLDEYGHNWHRNGDRFTRT